MVYDGHSFAVEVVALAEDTVGVRCAMGEAPDSGRVVCVAFPFEEGQYLYFMLVVVGAREGGEGLILQRAGSTSYVQRRKALRVPLDVEVAMRPHGLTSSQTVRAIDLSAEGMLIEASGELSIAETVDLMLPFPGAPGHLLYAKVVREATSNTAPERRRYGLWFVEIGQDARRSLILYLWERLRQLYPGEIAALFPGSRRRYQRRQAQDKQRKEA